MDGHNLDTNNTSVLDLKTVNTVCSISISRAAFSAQFKRHCALIIKTNLSKYRNILQIHC